MFVGSIQHSIHSSTFRPLQSYPCLTRSSYPMDRCILSKWQNATEKTRYPSVWHYVSRKEHEHVCSTDSPALVWLGRDQASNRPTDMQCNATNYSLSFIFFHTIACLFSTPTVYEVKLIFYLFFFFLLF